MVDPGGVVGLLGWLGWVIGIGAGVLEFIGFRRDRQLGPAKEQLFEEALRDRKGQYSEAQIIELTRLVRTLESAARHEVPRQARRVFLESQIETTADTIISSVKHHERLSEELLRLTGESREVPPEIARAVESSIVASSMERHRQQRRLYLAMIALLVVALFPTVWDYLRQTTVQLLGDQPQPFGTSNTLSFLAGCIVAICVAFAIPDRRLRRLTQAHRPVVVCAGLISFMLAISAVVYIGISLHLLALPQLLGSSPGRWYSYSTEASVIANIFVGIAVKLLSVLSPSRSV